VPLQDLVDRWHRDVDLLKALEIQADADWALTALAENSEAESDDRGSRCEVRLSQGGLEVIGLPRFKGQLVQWSFQLPCKTPGAAGNAREKT
jgi:hypothetical protein